MEIKKIRLGGILLSSNVLMAPLAGYTCYPFRMLAYEMGAGLCFTEMSSAGDSRVDVLQGSGNLLERGMLERMKTEPLFREKGILINKVYAAGLLPAFFPAATLLGAVLSYPISCALIGIGTIEQAETAFGSREDMETIPDFHRVLSVLERKFTPLPCDRCQRCVCPYGTEIHTVFRQYQYFFMGKEYWALRKLDMGIEQSAGWCRKCTEMPCLAMCPAGIRIPDEIQRIYRLVQTYSRGQ